MFGQTLKPCTHLALFQFPSERQRWHSGFTSAPKLLGHFAVPTGSTLGMRAGGVRRQRAEGLCRTSPAISSTSQSRDRTSATSVKHPAQPSPKRSQVMITANCRRA